MNRRSFLEKSPILAFAGSVIAQNGLYASPSQDGKPSPNTPIHHSVARWCFSSYALEDLLPRLKDLGIYSIDLIDPEEFGILKRHGFHCSMCQGAAISLTQGFNRPDLHDELVNRYNRVIPMVAEAGFKNLICFSGNRQGMNDLVGLENCAIGLERILPTAEKYGVVIQMELFNQQDHPDYMGDSSLWGISLCRRLNHPNFKLLFDIYHMQIQEGNIIDTINKYHSYFGHYHTAGVPGRNEIEENQELYYPAIMRAIQKTGYQGHVAQEFIPTRENPFDSLKRAIELCQAVPLEMP